MTKLFGVSFTKKRTSKAVTCVPQKPCFAYLEGRAPYLESRACVPRKPLGRTLKAVPAYLESRALLSRVFCVVELWGGRGAGHMNQVGFRVDVPRQDNAHALDFIKGGFQVLAKLPQGLGHAPACVT